MNQGSFIINTILTHHHKIIPSIINEYHSSWFFCNQAISLEFKLHIKNQRVHLNCYKCSRKPDTCTSIQWKILHVSNNNGQFYSNLTNTTTLLLIINKRVEAVRRYRYSYNIKIAAYTAGEISSETSLQSIKVYNALMLVWATSILTSSLCHKK